MMPIPTWRLAVLAVAASSFSLVSPFGLLLTALIINCAGERFVNGRQDDDRGMNFYSILSRTDGWSLQTDGFPIGEWKSGSL